MRGIRFVVVVAAGLVALGCSDDGDGGKGNSTPPATDPQAETPPSEIPVTPPSVLRKVQTCEDLTAAIKADALQKMNDSIDAQIESTKLWLDGQFGTTPGGGGADAANAAPAAPPGAGNGGSTGATPAPSAPATDYSQTNTQVKGVDEADLVKNDGKYIYLLHGNTFQVLTAWPAPTLASSSKLDIEGQPSEMFVANGKAVIFSAVNAATVYQAAGLTPRSRYSDGSSYVNSCSGGYACSANPITKITVLGVSGTTTGVERELYFEGTYVSSRRVDSHVRVVLQGAAYGPRIASYPDFSVRDPALGPPSRDERIAAFEALRLKNADVINATTQDSWLPYGFTKTPDGVHASLTACDRFFVPTQTTTQHGVTQIATFDLGTPDVVNSVAILGAVDTVYSNADALVLASRAWISPKKMVERPVNRKAPFVDFLPSTATYLHKFDLKTNPNEPLYVGSGSVPGQVQNQFSIDDREGIIRIATTEQRSVRTFISDDIHVRPFVNQFGVNRVLTVRTQGEALKVIGDAGDLAPGERIFSTRFVGTKGYVVTFRQIDPLFVIDLAKPEKPTVVAQLKIPGFSEYMHPLDDGHLLTIGRDTENGARRGVALQIFDVTQPTQPKLMHKYVFDASTYGYSEAEQNHKAFTYFESRKLLSFPFYGSSTTGFRSSAELFSIDLAAGITKVGAVDHTQLFGANNRGYCNGYFSPYVRRSVFMEDVLYSISYAGVIASDTKNLTAAPIATASLSAPLSEGAPCK